MNVFIKFSEPPSFLKMEFLLKWNFFTGSKLANALRKWSAEWNGSRSKLTQRSSVGMLLRNRWRVNYFAKLLRNMGNVYAYSATRWTLKKMCMVISNTVGGRVAHRTSCVDVGRQNQILLLLSFSYFLNEKVLI